MSKERPRGRGAVGAQRTVVCVGAHPDDPESGCGGTLIRLKQAGFRLVVVYLFNGGIPGDRPGAYPIRRAEAERACRVMGAEPVILFREHERTLVNDEWDARVAEALRKEDPVMVFGQWPLDAQSDHQLAAILTLRAVQALKPSPELYFYEVEYGAQTNAFSPSIYVDISAVQQLKLNAFTSHESQNPWRIYEQYHAEMESFRGRQAGVQAAEAFVPWKGGSTLLTRSLA